MRNNDLAGSIHLKKVFLGGTCNGSLWRDELIPMLKINYFNPVVDEWTAAMQEEEIRQRETADFCLYVITPKMDGFYAIAEVVDDSHIRPEKTLFCFLEKDGETTFNQAQLKSLQATKKLLTRNGVHTFDSLKDIADFLNEVKGKP